MALSRSPSIKLKRATGLGLGLLLPTLSAFALLSPWHGKYVLLAVGLILTLLCVAATPSKLNPFMYRMPADLPTRPYHAWLTALLVSLINGAGCLFLLVGGIAAFDGGIAIHHDPTFIIVGLVCLALGYLYSRQLSRRRRSQ